VAEIASGCTPLSTLSSSSLPPIDGMGVTARDACALQGGRESAIILNKRLGLHGLQLMCPLV
jgi:hypothetical protein